MVHGDEAELPRADVSGSEFEVGAPTSGEEEPREKRVRRNALQRVLSRLFLRVGCSPFYIAIFFMSVAHSPVLFLGDAETIPGVSGNEEVSTGVETDGQLRGRHIVVTRSLVALVGRSQHDVTEAVNSRS